MSKEEKKDILTPYVVTLIIVFTLAAIFFTYLFISDAFTGDKDNLMYMNQVVSSLSIAISTATIYLLYKTYNQQNVEMNKLNEANKELVKGNFRANDLQLILFEKQLIEKDHESLIRKFENEYYYYQAITSYIEYLERITSDRIDDINYELLSNVLFNEKDLDGSLLFFLVTFESKLLQLEKILSDKKLITIFATSLDSRLAVLVNIIMTPKVSKIISSYPFEYLVENQSMTNLQNLRFLIGNNNLKFLLDNYEAFN